MNANTVTTALADLESDIRNLRAKQAILRTNRTAINHRLVPLLKAHKAGWLTWDPSVHCEYDGITIYANMSNVDGFKHPMLMSILESYVDATDIKTRDDANSMTRVFTFSFAHPGLITPHSPIKVRLEVRVKDDSPTCVKVLKEVKEVVERREIYELVCSDGTTDEVHE